MARKSRKNTPIAVAEPTDNLTTKAVLSLDKQAKPYQVGIYARLSFESEANKERDTVDTQIAYIREFVKEQDDMVEVQVYADISVTGTTFERPEFDRMIQDIRAGKINTVITRDLSRLGRNYVEAGNYIERVFPFLDVRYIAITDDFDTARPGTDLSVPLKNIVNEYYSKDLSKKVETGKHSNKSGLYEDYREQLITAEELCQYQKEYECRVNEIEAQITELLHRRSLYEKEFHIDEGWEETVNKYMTKRKLTKELVDAFVSEIVFNDGNIEVKLLYDDFLKELLEVAEEREVSSNG